MCIVCGYYTRFHFHILNMKQDWINATAEAILNDHRTAYQEAETFSSKKAVLKVVKKALRAHHIQSIPKKADIVCG